MYYFLLIFIGLSVVSSWFIVSFHHLTRHYIEIQPGNSERVKGDILRGWSQFWEKITTSIEVYYEGDALIEKMADLQRKLPNTAKKVVLADERRCWVVTGITTEDLDNIERVLLCKCYLKDEFLFLYLEEPIYRFPSWIRKPMSQCVKCMASPFGTAIWIFVNSVTDLFFWTDNKILCFLIFWFIFIVNLTLINNVLYRKTVV